MSGLTPESVRAMLNAATPGPWNWTKGSDGWGHCGPDLNGVGDDLVLSSWGYDADGIEVEDPDKALIAAAPDLARAYLTQASALERVQALCEEPMKRANSAAAEYDDFRFEHGRQNLAYSILAALAGPTPSGDQT